MSSHILSKVGFVINQIKEGEIKSVFKVILNRINSKQLAFGFKRDLNEESKAPRTFVKTTIRPFKNDDVEHFNMDTTNISLINQIPTCYVATTKEDIPCIRLWLIDSSQNKKIKDFWGDTYPQLAEDEVLLESAFTIPKFRGLGLHSAVMYQVAEKAKDSGANFAIAFTPISNINSLRSLTYASFKPYIIRKEKYFLFKKSVIYEEISPELMEYYNNSTNRKRKAKS